MEAELDAVQERFLRGRLLRLVYLNHNAQRTRLTSVALHAVLHSEGFGFTEDHVLTQLQDLQDRGYIRYHQVRRGARMHLFDIELTSAGRDCQTGLKPDAAVLTD
jgi:hypothetical protein